MDLRAFMRLSRIEHGVLTSLIVIASYIISGGNNPIAMVLLFISSLLTEVFLFVTNDIYNIEEDRVNRPDAPLVRGDVSIRTAWVLSLISVSISILLNVVGVVLNYLAPWSISILIIAIITGFSYNYRLKRVVFVNNLLVAITSSLTFLYGLYAITSTLPTMNLPYLLFTVSLLATMGRELVKGALDIPGDIKAGVRTVANTYGITTAIVMAVAFTLTAVAVSPLIIILSLNEPFGFVLTIGVVITDLILTYICIAVLRRSDYADRFRSVSLLAMSVTIITYLLLALLILITK
ncbi:MAG: geranylgeranylglycerol-phosphate geranylgeranyltransferase [Vulcanisaeta sp.]